MLRKRKLEFYRHVCSAVGMRFCVIFLKILLSSFNNDMMLKSVFHSRPDAVRNVWLSLENYVTAWINYIVYTARILSVSLSVCLFVSVY